MSRAKIFIRLLTLFLLVTFLVTPESVNARSRSRSRNRNNGAAASAARRKQMIASIQSQVAQAKKFLASAESQVAMSQSEVNSAVGQLQGIASELSSMNTEHDAMLRQLHELETKLLDAQPDDSPLGKADDEVDRKLQALDDAFHQATGIPQHKESVTSAIRAAEMRNLTPEQKELLENSSSYKFAQSEVKSAVSHLETCRLDILKADSEWNRLHNDYIETSKKIQSAKGNSQGSGLSSLKANQGLAKSKNVADAARYAIAQGEMKIRQLGGNPNSVASNSKKSSSSKSSSSKKKK